MVTYNHFIECFQRRDIRTGLSIKVNVGSLRGGVNKSISKYFFGACFSYTDHKFGNAIRRKFFYYDRDTSVRPILSAHNHRVIVVGNTRFVRFIRQSGWQFITLNILQLI